MKHIFTLAMIIAGFLFSLAAWGQDDNYQQKKDSLLKVIPSLAGQSKLDAYEELSNLSFLNERNVDTIMKYLEAYKDEANQQGNSKCEGWARASIIAALTNSARHKDIIKRIDDDLAFFAKNEFWDTYYNNYRRLTSAYFFSGQKEKALQETRKMYDYAKERNHPSGVINALQQMGVFYNRTERLEEAIGCFKECLSMERQFDKISRRRLSIYFDFASAYSALRRFDEAESLLKEWEADLNKYEEQTEKEPVFRQNLYMIYLQFYDNKEEWDKIERYCRLIEEITNTVHTRRSSANHRLRALMAQKEYQKAYEQAEISQGAAIESGNQQGIALSWRYKAYLLAYLGRPDEAKLAINELLSATEEQKNLEINAQLDELRTQYEVDKHIAEKERNRNYFLFALGGVALLLILVIVILINRQKIHRKNKTMVLQIKELQEFQQTKENELLQKTTFQKPETDAADLCPESRKDKLCLKLRDWLLKDKIYRDASLSRDRLTEQLGINRHELEDAFLFCFGMHYGDYINELRLNDAVFMLEQSDLSIVEISEKTGFGTLRTFRRQFIAKYNMPPKNYQQLVRKK